jgi:hypothetical protein
MRASPERSAADTVRPGRPAAANSFIRSSSFGLTISSSARNGGACSLSTLNSHNACGTIRFIGDYQLQAGRPSGSGAKVRHGMRGQRYARLNLDLHAMTEAPESQTHVVDRGGRVLWHATNHNAVAQKTKSLSRGGPTEAQKSRWVCVGGACTQSKCGL